jgi:hypothetical protein
MFAAASLLPQPADLVRQALGQDALDGLTDDVGGRRGTRESRSSAATQAGGLPNSSVRSPRALARSPHAA